MTNKPSNTNVNVGNTPKVSTNDVRQAVTSDIPTEPSVKMTAGLPDETKGYGPDVTKQKNAYSQSNVDEEIKQLADEVEAGEHGNGQERMKALGVNYAKVHQELARRNRK